MAAISSLGIGSGVLTADVIDQLKAADESNIITPLENKITVNNQQQDATELLTSLMKSFKANASALSYDTIFDTKTVDILGEAEVTVDSGANVESFTLETVALAKKDINQFGSFSSKEASVADGPGVFKINIDSTDYEIAYDSGTSLSDLAQSITEIAGDDVEASILQTGDSAYSLILTSKNTGADNALTFTDEPDVPGQGLKDQLQAFDAVTNTAGYQNIQPASDSEFKYNGITATRSTNEISDLVLGVNITLKEEGDVSSVGITQNTDTITDEMQLFVDSYNTLISNLSDMTVKDEETGAEGIFNGNSFIKSIKRDLTSTITSMQHNDSLINYGIDIDRYGTMSFDKSALVEKLQDDPAGVEAFFTGSTDENGNSVDGIFGIINDKLNSYTGYGKLLSNFETGVKTDGVNLTDSYTKAQATLDNRYEIMTKRFTAYDSMISSLNSTFSSLQMIIDADSE